QVLFIFALCAGLILHAQGAFVPNTADTLAPKKPVPQKDISDILHSIFNKHHPRDTIQTKKFNWSLVPAAGYTLQTGFAGVVSGNIGFYEGK
ncbi:hypothetical protein NY590_16895, partial [Enterobacter kobei]|uniref:hypothetical protein n=1 Tax=Enterobacter kobei TaxID=208224 RepID=UPI0022F08712